MNAHRITIVAAMLALTAIATAPASAKPIFQPVSPAMQPIGGGSMFKPVNPAFQPIGKVPGGGCGKGWVGCNPNTWTPGHSGGYGVVGLGLAVAAQPVVTDGCYYVHRKVFVANVGLVRERVLVCD